MMNIEWDIIFRVINNKAQDADQEKFDAWYKHSNAEQKEFIQKIKAFYAEENMEEIKFTSTQINSQWEKQYQRINGKQYIIPHLLRYAATIALLISLCVVAYFVYDSNVSKNQIVSGSKQAVLTLPNGNQYDLSAPIEKILETKTVKVENKSNQLVLEKKQVKNIAQIEYNTIDVPRFGEYKLKLSDGTIVYLNSLSSLKFPFVFGENSREVYVKGEAYFEVAHNRNKPFIVHCNNTSIKVLGTEFNVRAYSKDITKATLVQGKIELKTEDNTCPKVILKPGEQGIVIRNNIEITKADILSVIAWKTGHFFYEDESLDFIMNELSMWYNFKVKYENPKLKQLKFYVYIDRNDDFKKVISKFELTHKVKITIKGETVIIGSGKK